MQIERLFKQLVAGLPHMRTALVVGGEPAAPQLHRLRSGVQIIVATPGRLHGLCRAHADVAEILSSVPVVVLDEVDQMLEHGLESQVRARRRTSDACHVVTLARPHRRSTAGSPDAGGCRSENCWAGSPPRARLWPSPPPSHLGRSSQLCPC